MNNVSMLNKEGAYDGMITVITKKGPMITSWWSPAFDHGGLGVKGCQTIKLVNQMGNQTKTNIMIELWIKRHCQQPLYITYKSIKHTKRVNVKQLVVFPSLYMAATHTLLPYPAFIVHIP